MRDDTFDVIVSGAGPAGSTCAIYLARSGLNVLVLEKEKFPRDKVCADNKTWKCLDIIKELGLWGEFLKLKKKEIRGVLIGSPSDYHLDVALLESDISEKGTWYNVRRELFDALLATAAKKEKNIRFREKCAVRLPIIKGAKVCGVNFVNEKGGSETAFAQIVVGADGSSSPIATELGMSPKIKGRYAINTRAYYQDVSFSSDRCELYYLKGICPGYFWIFPVDESTCNVGLGMRLEDIQNLQKTGMSLEGKALELINSERFATRFNNSKKLTEFKSWGVSVLPPNRKKWSGAGFVLIGDAGTFAMTFSGEGVGPAMRSGKVAAEQIRSAFERNDFSAKSLSEYDKAMRNILDPEVAGFKWLEFLLLNQAVFDYVIRRSAKNPKLLEICSRMQKDYSAAKEMINPSTLLRLLFG
ncbi:NAD(P)/FAD-dependent oxidoreductase [Candidatus Micrarchaeota archaeon]|nr:NAD(P)/FAD-dependent oxidoreductase [Candidatus Micrarchaeota archaeon]